MKSRKQMLNGFVLALALLISGDARWTFRHDSEKWRRALDEWTVSQKMVKIEVKSINDPPPLSEATIISILTPGRPIARVSNPFFARGDEGNQWP
jgi:hypothetical protein